MHFAVKAKTVLIYNVSMILSNQIDNNSDLMTLLNVRYPSIFVPVTCLDESMKIIDIYSSIHMYTTQCIRILNRFNQISQLFHSEIDSVMDSL